MDKPPDRAFAVGIDAKQQPRVAGGWLVVWERPGIEMLGDEAPSLGGIDCLETGRERLDLPGASQGQHLGSSEERLNRPPQLRPEFNLPGDGPLGKLRGEPGIEDQVVGELHGLAHDSRVAFCYRPVKSKLIEMLFPFLVRSIIFQNASDRSRSRSSRFLPVMLWMVATGFPRRG